MIYKPEHKKDYFVPTKRPTTSNNQKDTTKVNDSFNASKIVSSLVEANKSKLMNNANNLKNKKQQDNFEKVEEFKLFPKTHKNNSQI